uniref:Uncharacterized protein n=1 Tax=Anguilla anguilla TaxID=7936 RepID=A0A0E9VAG4_ANGAN
MLRLVSVTLQPVCFAYSDCLLKTHAHAGMKALKRKPTGCPVDTSRASFSSAYSNEAVSLPQITPSPD